MQAPGKTVKSLVLSATVLATFALSSVAHAGSCRIYEHNHYKGAAGTIRAGHLVKFFDKNSSMLRQYNTPYHDPSWANKVSSVQVDHGCHAILWGSTIHGHHTLRSNTPDLGKHNDKAYAVKCECNY